MTHYIALIHKEAGSIYGVSFPDLPGVTTAADSLDEAIRQAAEVLVFAAEDWSNLAPGDFPTPRTIDEIRDDPTHAADLVEAIVAAIPMRIVADAA